MLTKDDLDRLERLARAALERRPGPWHAVHTPNEKYPYDDVDPETDAVWSVSRNPKQEGWRTDGGFPGYGVPKAIAEHMAAADPQTVLDLIALARRAMGPSDTTGAR